MEVEVLILDVKEVEDKGQNRFLGCCVVNSNRLGSALHSFFYPQTKFAKNVEKARPQCHYKRNNSKKMMFIPKF